MMAEAERVAAKPANGAVGSGGIGFGEALLSPYASSQRPVGATSTEASKSTLIEDYPLASVFPFPREHQC